MVFETELGDGRDFLFNVWKCDFTCLKSSNSHDFALLLNKNAIFLRNVKSFPLKRLQLYTIFYKFDIRKFIY